MQVRARYSRDADALYLTITPHSVATSVPVDDGTFADLDAAGWLTGVEVIRPGRPWPLEEILARYPCEPTAKLELRAGWPDKYTVRAADVV